ncbi:MAG TPA: hypothetical protein V6D05_08585 [Stenomitos sp.]
MGSSSCKPPIAKRALLSVAMVAGLLAGCEWPRVSPESSLPGLIAIHGQALLPMDYVVAADTQPAPRSFRASLVTMGGATLAVGTILDSDGNFAVHVPSTSLTASPTLYEIDLLDSGGSPTYRSLVRLTQQYVEATVTVNGTSSTIALAAREALRQGKDPSNWDYAALLKDPQVQVLGLQYANQIARWSNGPTIASDPPAPSSSSLDQVISRAALP